MDIFSLIMVAGGLAFFLYGMNIMSTGLERMAGGKLEKLLKSAMANAEHNFQMDKNNLYVAECFVTPGPTLKRVMPRAQGRAYRILKRTSHMTVVLKEIEE